MNQDQSSLEKLWLARTSEMETFEPDQADVVHIEDVPEERGAEERGDDGFSGLSRRMISPIHEIRDFSRRMLSPIHEIPTRNRFDTAETDQICNYVRSDTPVAMTQFLSKQDEDDSQGDDASSVVSSLSKDDSLLAQPVVTPLVIQGDISPPTEVSIPAKGEDTPDWLMMEHEVTQPILRRDQSLPSNVVRPALHRDQSAPSVMMRTALFPPAPSARTVMSSPSLPRPAHGRNHPSPPMDFSIACSSIRTSNSSLVAESLDFIEGATQWDGRLLGDRKRRTMCRVQSNSSVGSFVGQSSFTTAPTVSSSYTGSETCSARKNKASVEASRKLVSHLGADDGVACCALRAEEAYRKKNVVKEELKYMIGLVSSPIRNLPLLKKGDSPQNVNLTRSGGCLT